MEKGTLTESSSSPPVVHAGDICKEVVQPVRVRGRFFGIPQFGVGELLVESSFGLRLIIDTVEPDYTL